jgi:prevent-host-death family protein
MSESTSLSPMGDELVNMHEAKTHLSRLVERVLAGEEIVIGRAGTPVAKLVPYEDEAPPKYRFGLAKGRIWIAPDIDEADEEIEDLFSESLDAPLPEP